MSWIRAISCATFGARAPKPPFVFTLEIKGEDSEQNMAVFCDDDRPGQ